MTARVTMLDCARCGGAPRLHAILGFRRNVVECLDCGLRWIWATR